MGGGVGKGMRGRSGAHTHGNRQPPTPPWPPGSPPLKPPAPRGLHPSQPACTPAASPPLPPGPAARSPPCLAATARIAPLHAWSRHSSSSSRSMSWRMENLSKVSLPMWWGEWRIHGCTHGRWALRVSWGLLVAPPSSRLISPRRACLPYPSSRRPLAPPPGRPGSPTTKSACPYTHHAPPSPLCSPTPPSPNPLCPPPVHVQPHHKVRLPVHAHQRRHQQLARRGRAVHRSDQRGLACGRGGGE